MYQNKYFKYKQKYLAYKNLIGGEKDCTQITNTGSQIPANTVNDPYDKCEINSFIIIDSGNKILKHLKQIMDDDGTPQNAIIVKIGSNDTTSGGAKKGAKMWYEHIPKAGSFIVPVDRTDHIHVRKYKLLQEKFTNIKKLSFICIDPENPSEYPMNINENDTMNFQNIIETNKNNFEIYEKILIRACFPLAPNIKESVKEGNEIIKLLSNYTGTLILLNCMGSICYNSMKKIIDLRLSNKRPIFYFTIVDVPENAYCNFDNILYDNLLHNCNLLDAE